MVVMRSQEWHRVDLTDLNTFPPYKQVVLVYPFGGSRPHIAILYDSCGDTPIWRNLREPFYAQNGDWWMDAPMPPEEAEAQKA